MSRFKVSFANEPKARQDRYRQTEQIVLDILLVIDRDFMVNDDNCQADEGDAG